MNKIFVGVLALSLMGMSLSCSKKDAPTPNPPKPDNKELPKPDKPKGSDDKPKPNPGDKPNPDGKPDEPKDKPNPPTPPKGGRPADHEMGTRATAKWKVSGDALYGRFDLETLWLSNQKTKYNTQYLASFVEFGSSSVDGIPYVFTASDLKETAISSISYDEHGETLKLKLKYKTSESKELSLEFKKSEYYSRKVKAKPEAASKLYITGVERHLGVFLSDLFEYDDRYVLEVQKNINPSPNYSSQSLTVYATLSLKNGNRELAKLQLQAKGFRSFSNLKGDIQVRNEDGIVDFAEKHKALSGSALAKAFDREIQKSLDDVLQIQARGFNMTWDGNALKSTSNDKGYLDLYFPNVRFRTTSAQYVMEGAQKKFTAVLKLEAIGDIPVNGVTFQVSTAVPNK